MLRTTRRVAVVAALASTAALAGAASASAALTMSDLPSSAPIIQKLYVPIPLSLGCDPNPWGFFAPGYATVTIRQVVSGKTVAHGTATVTSVTCDGAPHDYTANVFPDTGGNMMMPSSSDSPPFAKGDAVVSAQFSTMNDGAVSAGPQPVKLTK